MNLHVFAILVSTVFQLGTSIQLEGSNGENARHQFANISVTAVKGSKWTEIELEMKRQSGNVVHSKIYMGGMPGIRYSAKRDGGEKEKFILAGVRLEKEKKSFGGATIEWYATLFEDEQASKPTSTLKNAKKSTPSQLDDVYKKYELTVKEVVAGFKLLPQDKGSEIAETFRDELKAAITAVKESEEENRESAVVEAIKTFDANTEAALEKYELQRKGAKLPSKISVDPWILRRADFCGSADDKHICHGLGLAEYVLIVTFFRYWLEDRIDFFIDQFKIANVSHVVSLLSQRQAVASIQPYSVPYGSGRKVLQFEDISWDGYIRSVGDMIQKVKRAIDQPHSDFAISSHFKGSSENVYANHLKDASIELVWPAWEMEPSVPSLGWCNAARYKMFPELTETLKMSNGVYVHCEGGGGRTGMFVIILLMELTGCYWLDALKIIRHVSGRSVEGAQQVLWVVWYWKTYTAKLLPLEGGLDDESNWDTGVQREMDNMVHAPDVMFSDDAHNSKEQVCLKDWLDAERSAVKSRVRAANGLLIPDDQLEKRKHRAFVGGTLCVMLYTTLVLILGALAFMIYAFPLTDESKSSPQPDQEAGIEMSTKVASDKLA